MAQIFHIHRMIFQRLRPALQRRLVSTSKKNNDTVAADVCKTTTKAEVKNWISYGFDFNSKTNDRAYVNAIFFAAISLCMVGGGFSMAYAPDFPLRDWSVREAFLELRRREAAGKPLIDPNFISPEKIILPSDEDLGATEIII